MRAICETCSIKSNMVADDRAKNMDKIASFIACERKVDDSLGGWLRHATSGHFLVSTYLVLLFLFWCKVD